MLDVRVHDHDRRFTRWIDDDLVRMKTLLEAGRTRVHDERVELDEGH